MPSAEDSSREAKLRELVDETEGELVVVAADDFVWSSEYWLDIRTSAPCLSGIPSCLVLIIDDFRGLKNSLAAIDCLCLNSF